MLPNDQPIITIVIKSISWKRSIDPLEGTPDGIGQFRDTTPCMVVCSLSYEEIGLTREMHYLVPSKIMPQFSLSHARGSELVQGHLVSLQNAFMDQFASTNRDMHKFLTDMISSTEPIKTGLGQF